MENNSFDEFQRRFNLARNGGGILFCGAGFSADCLNFKPDETLGTGEQLLNLFNTELHQDPPFKVLQNAADELKNEIFDFGMMTLLKERFTVSDVTADMTDLLRYPWQAVYTTNYDNALEIAAQAAHKPAEPLNNTDDPSTTTQSLPIIHLHGYVGKWDIHNFGESCVLGAESYSKLTHVKKWLNRLRRDIDQAQIVVFVGFNAGDFHLNQAINDLTGLHEKAFFINRPTAQANPDIFAAQKRLGTPFFTGRAGLAATIKELLAKDAPKAPRLASFVKYTPPDPAATVPTQAQIEDLFLYGKVDPSQLARDASSDVSDYHIRRSAIQEALDAIEGDTRILLFDGYACDGKSLLTTDLAYRLSGARLVYQMRQAYESVLNEVADILHHTPNATLIIENCFDLSSERLTSIARQFDGQDGVLILTSRAVAVDASPTGLAALEGFRSFRKMPLVQLDENEARSLSDLADQIAGWRDFHSLDSAARLRFILGNCNASLPHFLMRLLQSDYVTQRYREEFSKLALSQTEREAIIIALYLTHIGENIPVSFLSNAMEKDCGAIFDKLNARAGNDTFRLVRRTGETIQTVPSIGAQNILQNLFNDAEIVDVIVPLLKQLAAIHRNPFEQRMFRQLIRFSILSDIVTDRDEIDRFFEHNKQTLQIRRMPLFWLQWHMAKCAAGELTVAEKLLEQGYSEATEYERRTGNTFDRRQLHDRRAKFLMLRAEQNNRTGVDLYRDFKEAIELTGKILRQKDPQHFPFETLAHIVHTRNEMGYQLAYGHKDLIDNFLKQLVIYARERIGLLTSEYQRDKAQFALNNIGPWL
ncbi:SIR2 family protein [Thalassospiraceae bacterium SW-3-3]|nr:SIR2 family protein [Thalassospiraceae bacterium SW-3-3]